MLHENWEKYKKRMALQTLLFVYNLLKYLQNLVHWQKKTKQFFIYVNIILFWLNIKYSKQFMKKWLFIVKTNTEKYILNSQMNLCNNELHLRKISQSKNKFTLKLPTSVQLIWASGRHWKKMYISRPLYF